MGRLLESDAADTFLSVDDLDGDPRHGARLWCACRACGAVCVRGVMGGDQSRSGLLRYLLSRTSDLTTHAPFFIFVGCWQGLFPRSGEGHGPSHLTLMNTTMIRVRLSCVCVRACVCVCFVDRKGRSLSALLGSCHPPLVLTSRLTPHLIPSPNPLIPPPYGRGFAGGGAAPD